MLWALLTLLAVAIWGIANVIDKYVVNKRVKNPLIPLILHGLGVLAYGYAVFLTHGISIPDISFIFYSILLGILYFLVLLFYFKSMKLEELSRVIPLMGLHPIFTLVFATIFLGEIFTGIKYLGIFLLIIGGILLSIKKEVKLTVTKALPWLILFNVFLAVYYVFLKYTLNFSDYWSVFILMQIGFFIGTLFLMPTIFSDMKKVIKNDRKTIGIVFLSQFINVIGLLLYMAALSIAFVSLVAALEQVQNLLVLFYATLISIFMPRILKEEIKGSIILLKIVAILCMFIGAYLII